MGFDPAVHALPTSRDETSRGEVLAAEERIERMRVERDTLAERERHAQEQQSKYYNKAHKPLSFNVGDIVLLSVKNLRLRLLNRKLSSKYDRPFQVLALRLWRACAITYSIECPVSLAFFPCSCIWIS